MPTLTAYVANCLMGGDEVTSNSNGSWIRDLINFNCNGRVFRFRQNPDVINKKYKPFEGAFYETTTVEVENVESYQRENILKEIDNICWLLSFACQARVICYGHDFLDTGSRKAAFGKANLFRPPIEIADGTAVKNFIEQTYPAYAKLNKKRKISTVIDYLTQLNQPGQPIEINLLIIFITLENLKDTYAKQAKIPYAKGYYRKSPTKPGKPGRQFNFEELLVEMFKAVGMRKGVKQIITLRNELIHSGLSRKSYSSQIKLYERTQDLVREYLVRLLNYRGYFFTYSSRGTAPKKI